MLKFIISLLSLAVMSSEITQAQKFSFELGVSNTDYIQNSINYTTPLKNSFSPYLGINYHLPSSQSPISFGVKINKFNFQFLDKDIRVVSSPDHLLISNDYTFINLQFPILYHISRGRSRLSAGISPAIYFLHSNSSSIKMPRWNITEITNYNQTVLSSKPNQKTANIDLTLKYAYMFSKIGKKNLGVSAYLNYPLLHNVLQQELTHIYNINYNNGGKFSSYNTITNSISPYTIGVGIIVN